MGKLPRPRFCVNLKVKSEKIGGDILKDILVDVEGVDGSGKETQAKKLAEFLGAVKQSFPRYGHPSAARLERYLHGEEVMDAYQASIAFAEDRADWARTWREKGCPTTVLDRFSFSNYAYQGVRVENHEEYLRWAKAQEAQMGVPIPDKLIYLVWEKDAWLNLLLSRGSAKHTGKDIHESNLGFLNRVYDFGLALAKEEGATIIHCDGCSIDEVHELVKRAVL